MRETRVRRDEGEESEDSVDNEALVRLEALQRDRMAEMFGLDDEPQEKRALKQKPGKTIAAKPTIGKGLQKKAGLKKNLKQPSSGALIPHGKVSQKGEKLGKKAAGKQVSSIPGGSKVAAPASSKPSSGSKELSDFRKRSPAAASAAGPKSSEELAKERASFMSSSVAKIHNDNNAGDDVLRGRKRRRPGQDEAAFMTAARSVAELGASGFDKRKKKDWEAQKMKALGARDPKKLKVPYNILMGQLKKQKERDDKRQKLEAEAGLVLKKPKAKGKGKTKVSLNTSGVLRVDTKGPSRNSFLPKQRK